MKRFFLVISTLTSLLLFIGCGNQRLNSQNFSVQYDSVGTHFVKHYNQGDYSDIYNLLSSSFQNGFTLEENIEFFTTLKSNYGKIDSMKVVIDEESLQIRELYLGSVKKQMSLSLTTDSKIALLKIKTLIKPLTTESHLILPFEEQWYTHWGGTKKWQNYHITSARQIGAFDFAIRDEKGKTFKGDGTVNEEYYAWNQNIICPCKGEVVKSSDNIQDNTPGKVNNKNPHGNYLMIKCKDVKNEYLVLYHLKRNSIEVEVGEEVSQGEILGKCGNSGRSTEPHLHFHIQDNENDEKAVGILSVFQNIYVDENLKERYSPIRGDFIRNTNEE